MVVLGTGKIAGTTGEWLLDGTPLSTGRGRLGHSSWVRRYPQRYHAATVSVARQGALGHGCSTQPHNRLVQ